MWQAKKDQTQALSPAMTNLTRPIAKQRLKELSGNDLTLAVEHQVMSWRCVRSCAGR
jgi:hypothetical protein